ncbi:MAG: regulatory protein RecX, partial [Mycobacteriales bacterium]
ARTRAQLAGALARRGVPGPAAEAALDRLGELGLVDDTAYAAAFVATRTGTRSLGQRELRRALREKGVSEELAALAVVGVDDEAGALAFARSRAVRLARLPREVAVRRLTGQLLRRGYSSAVISRVLRETL